MKSIKIIMGICMTVIWALGLGTIITEPDQIVFVMSRLVVLSMLACIGLAVMPKEK